MTATIDVLVTRFPTLSAADFDYSPESIPKLEREQGPGAGWRAALYKVYP